jgi:excisionase family DNA binding protein
MLSVNEVAERLRVCRDSVDGWIAAGELAAVNLAKAGAKRKTYRVSEEALAAFLARRSSGKRVAPGPKRRSGVDHFG